MFAIAFDLTVADTITNHPVSATQAYSDIKVILQKYDFDWVQGSLYVTENEDMANLFRALMALRALPWFPPSVRDIRAFRIEQWSNFTSIVKDE